jgi:hypothetical protein
MDDWDELQKLANSRGTSIQRHAPDGVAVEGQFWVVRITGLDTDPIPDGFPLSTDAEDWAGPFSFHDVRAYVKGEY